MYKSEGFFSKSGNFFPRLRVPFPIFVSHQPMRFTRFKHTHTPQLQHAHKILPYLYQNFICRDDGKWELRKLTNNPNFTHSLTMPTKTTFDWSLPTKHTSTFPPCPHVTPQPTVPEALGWRVTRDRDYPHTHEIFNKVFLWFSFSSIIYFS